MSIPKERPEALQALAGRAALLCLYSFLHFMFIELIVVALQSYGEKASITSLFKLGIVNY